MLWRLKKVHTAVRLPAIPCLCMAETTSSSVKSGCFSISVSSHCACPPNGDVPPPRGLAAQLPVSRKHFTHLTAALGLMSSCSAASRREAPPSTRAITRMRMSTEYAFGMVRPPDESMPPDSPTYRSLGTLRFYSARTCSSSLLKKVFEVLGFLTAGWLARKQAQCDIGCRQPKMKHRISAAATEGANGMRFLSPTCWTSAHPNLAATTCAAEKIASRIAKGNAQPKPTHRKPTVNILT